MAFSCQPRRTKAYNEDLRWRIVWQGEALGLSQARIAANLNVDRSTVSRILSLFRHTGEVNKKVYPKEQAFRKLTEPAQFLILKLAISKPGVYLEEIQKEVLLQLMIDVNHSRVDLEPRR